MKWWLISGVVVLALGAAWYFGLAKIGRALLGMVADGLTTFREWIRRPGSKLKALCAVLALACACISLFSFQRGRQIVTIQTEFVAYRASAEAAANQCKADIADRDQRIAEFVRLAVDEQDKLKELAAQAKGATVEAEKAKADAKRTRAQYERLYQNKPSTCSAALDLLQSECASLSDY